MTDVVAAVAEVLERAGQTHHAVYRIVDGEDPDWASWYADWLLELSELPSLLGSKPVRSELVYTLVGLAKELEAEHPGEDWRTYYARGLVERLGARA